MSTLLAATRAWLVRTSGVLNAARPTAGDYPNDLQLPRPAGRQVTPAWGTLALLVLFTLIPRVLMAFRVGVICSDGAYYVQLAEALERGDIAQALNMQFNIFPVILAGLHCIGLSWETAGEVWGILTATLVVLPLFGWVRRQFDDRVAIVACALYAVHPELIEWSPEVVREPTFWCMFTLTLYLLWRAITEVRIGYFLAAGLSLTLSALTRFEGLFLLIPLVAWSVVRWRALEVARARLTFGALACPLALPTLLLIINVCWLHERTSLDLLRLEPLKRVEHWVTSFWNKSTPRPVDTIAAQPTTVTPTTPTPVSPVTTVPAKRPNVAWLWAHTVERGVTPFFGLLMMGGFFVWWRVFTRSDQLPLIIVALVVCGGIWIHLWYTQQASGRYLMSIVIMSTRCAAVALIDLALVMQWCWKRCGWERPAVRWLAALTLTLATIGWIDALTTTFRSRELSAELGCWIRQHYGEPRVIFGVDEQMAIISYHAHANYWEPPRGVAGDSLVQLVNQNPPEVIVVANGAARAKDFQTLIKDGERFGFHRVDPRLLPRPADRVIVLSRLPMVR